MVFQVVFDYDDQMKIPFLRDYIKGLSEEVVSLRYVNLCFPWFPSIKSHPYWVYLLGSNFFSFTWLLQCLDLSYCFADRTEADGEVGQQDLHQVGIVPKFPGRFYYYFGKPIETEGMVIGQLVTIDYLHSNNNHGCSRKNMCQHYTPKAFQPA
jgi:hypothetical protein